MLYSLLVHEHNDSEKGWDTDQNTHTHKKLFLYLLFIRTKGAGESRYIRMRFVSCFLSLVLFDFTLLCFVWHVTERAGGGWPWS